MALRPEALPREIRPAPCALRTIPLNAYTIPPITITVMI
jgi:hypothetical protein